MRDPRLNLRQRPALFAAVAVLAAMVVSTPSQAQKPTIPFNVVPITIQSVNVVNGTLMATGLLGNQPFTAPVTLSATPNAADPTCPILNLHLGAISLNLLGLAVNTSPICLAVTAHQGGGLLGDLLCGVANLLNGGTPLADILNGLSTDQLTMLLNGLTGLLNGALTRITSSTSFAGVSGTAAGACDILNLSLGPVNLNLLGLQVYLDNCNNGPVTVDITAIPGAGNLLGNLLCTLDNLLNHSNASNVAINAVLRNVARVIYGLTGLPV